MIKDESEILICPSPLYLYEDATTFDGTNLSHVMLLGNHFMKIVEQFPYLGDIVARDYGDGCAVDSRVSAARKAFGALRKCVFSTTSVDSTAKRAVYL